MSDSIYKWADRELDKIAETQELNSRHLSALILRAQVRLDNLVQGSYLINVDDFVTND